MSEKMSVQEIEARFDNEVERFSNLETGQVAITDARLMLDLLTEAASCVNPDAKEVCEILKISETNLYVRLHRARERVRQAVEAYLEERKTTV